MNYEYRQGRLMKIYPRNSSGQNWRTQIQGNGYYRQVFTGWMDVASNVLCLCCMTINHHEVVSTYNLSVRYHCHFIFITESQKVSKKFVNPFFHTFQTKLGITIFNRTRHVIPVLRGPEGVVEQTGRVVCSPANGCYRKAVSCAQACRNTS